MILLQFNAGTRDRIATKAGAGGTHYGNIDR